VMDARNHTLAGNVAKLDINAVYYLYLGSYYRYSYGMKCPCFSRL